jgi:hypothetical protein
MLNIAANRCEIDRESAPKNAKGELKSLLAYGFVSMEKRPCLLYIILWIGGLVNGIPTAKRSCHGLCVRQLCLPGTSPLPGWASSSTRCKANGT